MTVLADGGKTRSHPENFHVVFCSIKQRFCFVLFFNVFGFLFPIFSNNTKQLPNIRNTEVPLTLTNKIQ